MDEVAGYATCMNDKCQWRGFAFAPPPNQVGKRICPSCGEELKKWRTPDERRDESGPDEGQ